MKKWILSVFFIVCIIILLTIQMFYVDPSKHKKVITPSPQVTQISQPIQASQSVPIPQEKIRYKPAQKPAQPSQKKTIESFISTSLNPGAIYHVTSPVVVAKDSRAFSLLVYAIFINDPEGIVAMEKQGMVYVLDKPTFVRYHYDISGDYFGINRKTSKITIESGKYIGKEAYIFTDSIQE